jgi:sugar O-acyltransferase (sialic acid O-acetyltransferase NeuD family)
MKPLVILGSRGYAQEVLWVVDDINALEPTWDFLGFIDPGAPERKGATLYGRPVLGGFDTAPKLPGGIYFACGIGTPAFRLKECTEAERLGWMPASLIHPTVVIAKFAEVGAGTIVGAGSILAPFAKVGRHCAINLHVTVGHDSRSGDYCVLSPGARISGGVILEDVVFLGSNATVYPNRHVGKGASLAANSFLVTNLAAGRSAVGVPAAPFTQALGGRKELPGDES